MEGLKRAGEPVPAPAADALLRAQLPDGGWFWSFDAEKERRRYHLPVMESWPGRRACAASLGTTVPPAISRPRNWRTAAGAWTRRPMRTRRTPIPLGLAVAGLKAAAFDPDTPPFQKNGLGVEASLLAFPGGRRRIRLHPAARAGGSAPILSGSIRGMSLPLMPPARRNLSRRNISRMTGWR